MPSMRIQRYKGSNTYSGRNGWYSLEDMGSDSTTLAGYLPARARDAARVEPLLYTPKPIVPAVDTASQRGQRDEGRAQRTFNKKIWFVIRMKMTSRAKLVSYAERIPRGTHIHHSLDLGASLGTSYRGRGRCRLCPLSPFPLPLHTH